MEIKAKINKPYTEEERVNFIIEENHQNGYEIRESEDALEAWGYTEIEKENALKEKQIENLKKQLTELDLKAMRSMRAIIAGTSVNDDVLKISELEAQAQEIRNDISELVNP